MQRWQIIAEAMLLAVLLGSSALMRAEPLISMTGSTERGSGAQYQSAALPESRDTPRK